MHTKFCWGNLTERDDLEDFGIDGRIVLEEMWEGVDWIYVGQDREKYRVLVNRVWSLQVP
jgi:hypothetical protein